MSGSLPSQNIEKALQQQVLSASSRQQSLCIIGGASKSFYGREAIGEPIYTSSHCGVVHYDPAELVVTVRAGTRVRDLQELLATENQRLGFVPPQFSAATTIGGAVAAGLAGPCRPYVGAVRDFVLGVKLLNGVGDIMRFGGQVMKNVAGFDIARLMAGAMGTLGILLEISLRISPQPQLEKTLVLSQPKFTDAIAFLNQFAACPLPLSASAWVDGKTRIHLSGNAVAVEQADKIIGGKVDDSAHQFWQQLRDHDLPFFRLPQPLVRISVPPNAAIHFSHVTQLVEWGGAQHWIAGNVDIDEMRKVATAHGGHATLFRHGDRQSDVFQTLAPALHALHVRLKHAFDPAGILNPGRMYRDL